MKHLFYHNHKQVNGSIDPVEIQSDIKHALSLHPFKNHKYMYLMQMYLHNLKLQGMQKYLHILQQDIGMARRAHMEVSDLI